MGENSRELALRCASTLPKQNCLRRWASGGSARLALRAVKVLTSRQILPEPLHTCILPHNTRTRTHTHTHAYTYPHTHTHMPTPTRTHPHTQTGTGSVEEAHDMQCVQVAICMGKRQWLNIEASRCARGTGGWEIWQTPGVEK